MRFLSFFLSFLLKRLQCTMGTNIGSSNSCKTLLRRHHQWAEFLLPRHLTFGDTPHYTRDWLAGSICDSPRRIGDIERPARDIRVRRWRCRSDGRCPGAAAPPSGCRRRPSRCDSDVADSVTGIPFRRRWRWTGFVDDGTGIRSANAHPSFQHLEQIVNITWPYVAFTTIQVYWMP